MKKEIFLFTNSVTRRRNSRVCHRLGYSTIVSRIGKEETLENLIISAVEEVIDEKGLESKVEIISSSDEKLFIVKNGNQFYLVKPLSLRKFEVMLSYENQGFYIPRGVKFVVCHSQDMTVFWMIDQYTNAQVGHYYYVNWIS